MAANQVTESMWRAAEQLRELHGPVPAVFAGTAVQLGRGALSQLGYESLGRVAQWAIAGDYERAERNRWWYLASVRELAWRRMVGRVGPAGGPFHYEPMGGCPDAG